MRKNRLLAAVCAAVLSTSALAGSTFLAEDIDIETAQAEDVIESAEETAEEVVEAASIEEEPAEAEISEEGEDAEEAFAEEDVLVELAEEEPDAATDDGLIIDSEEIEPVSEGEEVTFDGACGEGLVWGVADGVLTIAGEGDMDDYSLVTPAPWVGEDVTAIVVEEGVTGIGTYAFNAMTDVIAVDLPQSLLAAREGAFRDMTSLELISVPTESNAFDVFGGVLYTMEGRELVCYPQGLKDAAYEVPAGVEVIDAYAFYGQDSLQKLVLPNTVAQIGDNAFAECTVLTDITLG